MKKKFWLLALAAVVIVAGGISQWASRHYVVPIMMYHHVRELDRPDLNTVSPERFEWHMAYLKKNNFTVLPLETVAEAIRAGKQLPAKSVAITFDDGYRNNYTQAYPILKKYNFPATIYVVSDSANTEGYLTTAQMKEMSANGITIGSHTRTHAYLPEISGEARRDEIFGSKKILEEMLGIPVDHFCYPIGGFNEETKRFVEEAGYKSAATTNRGHDHWNRDVYAIQRIRFSNQDNRSDYLWMKLSGFYNVFRKTKNPY